MTLSVAPSPTPQPTVGNGTVDSWQCVNRAPVATAVPAPPLGAQTNQIYIPGYDCAVTHWSLQSPAPLVSPVINNTYAATSSPAPTPTPYAGGFTPQDTGNWSDIGPWFATLLVAVVLGPYCLMTFLRWIREVFSHV